MSGESLHPGRPSPSKVLSSGPIRKTEAKWITHLDEGLRGRNWAIRLPLLIYFALVFRKHLDNPFYTSLVGGLNLGIHELGHFLWAPFGELWAVLGGSLTQCLVPVLVAYLFYRQRDFFAISVAACWLATNLFGVATYAADGLTQQLPLVSPGGVDPEHDWGYLLTRWNKLSKAREFGEALRSAASFFMVSGLVVGGWLLWRMRRLGRSVK